MTERRVTLDGGERLQWITLGIGVLGIVLFLLGIGIDPRRAYFSYLAAYTFGVSIALGAMLMVMIAHLTNARWFTVFRRLAEAIAATLPVFLVLSIPLLFGLEELFPWARPTASLEPEVRELIAKKRPYLNVPFFLVRTTLYIGVWIVVGHLLRTWSLRQEGEQEPDLAHRQKTLSAVALPAVAFTLTFAAFDWLMSLSPEWASTMWGVYYFAGGIVAALGLLAVLGWGLRREGTLREELNPSHFHTLGKLLLTFLLFWAYIAYSQYFIVWIADVPSEVRWYLPRIETTWGWIALTLLLGHFALPFFALLSQRLKRRPGALAAVGAWVVLMHYVDIYWLVLPTLHPVGFRPHWLDGAALLGVVGIATAYGVWRLRGHPVIPLGDPALPGSLAYATGVATAAPEAAAERREGHP